jgi:hypothetical protein
MAGKTAGRYVCRRVAQWAVLVSERVASGMRQREFCKRHGLSSSSFSHWRRSLESDSHQGWENDVLEVAVPRPAVDPA